nr:phosphoribosylanthranilate isomerase [Haloferula luteola]
MKICGVTRASDAERLAELGVDALGVNFWPKSKRFLDPSAAAFLEPLAGRILRVGVFVNAGTELPRQLMEKGWLDAVQLHGDEPVSDLETLAAAGVPVIRALSSASASFEVAPHECELMAALLLDAHAPGIYGGTGQTINWTAAGTFIHQHPQLSILLAGGIVPSNAAEAIRTVRPCALDIASGAESSPGVKDFEKVSLLLQACTESTAH